MNIKTIIKYLNRKINKINRLTDNPFEKDFHKNFDEYQHKTRVWVEKPNPFKFE